MSRILVTGSAGFLGLNVVAVGRREGHEVVEFDLQAGHDVRNRSALFGAAAECNAIIHLASQDSPTPAAEIVETIVIGTRNVVDAAGEQGVRRVVIVSSAEALGVFMGESAPDYLPIDDTHPARPTTPYGAAKLAAEHVARRASVDRGLEVICLRPPGVCDDSIMQWIRDERTARASFEWDPIWEYGAWIHVDDLSSALLKATSCPPPGGGYACHLIAASTNNSDAYGSRELASKVHPEVAWRGGQRYEGNSALSLIDTRPVQGLLGWEPKINWRDRAATHG